ncbi:hypothetical protein K469DRAFT_688501 [Zopfia rhizophila CBS 207.26]|uniref:Uncharacterized protein n=1 Tax=Zopfia rhizophila CBS 207.26 TaxID=1314779 RepID=A0A6A6E343_9PEZI|nr:hypothetical protein K469DRAFT_688501 [Zopfia rhizophila CBS 207.26]
MFHEIFMLASLGTLLNTYIRRARTFTMATLSSSSVADGLAELQRFSADVAANGEIGKHQKLRKDVAFKTDSLQPFFLAWRTQNSLVSNGTASLQFPNFGNTSPSNGPASAHQFDSSAEISHYVPFDDSNTTVLIAGSQNVTFQGTRNYIKVVLSAPQWFDTFGNFRPDYRTVNLAVEWAKYLIPILPDANWIVSSTIASTASIWNSTLAARPHYFELIVDSITATLVANGIGRASYNRSMLMNFRHQDDPSNPLGGGEFAEEILPKRDMMGAGRDAFDMYMTILGYAYSLHGKTQKAVMAVLSLMVFYRLGIRMRVNRARSQFSSYGKLRNTGVTIETVDVLKENIKVKL